MWRERKGGSSIAAAALLLAASGAAAAKAAPPATSAKPSIGSVAYSIAHNGGLRVLALTARVSGANRCWLVSARLTHGRGRSLPCSGRGPNTQLSARLVLRGKLAAAAFTAGAALGASGGGHTRWLRFIIRVPSVAQEREAAEKAQAALRERERLSQGAPNAHRTPEPTMPGQPPSKKEEPKQPEPDPTTTLRVAGDKAMVGLVEELAAAYRAEGSGVAVTVTALANGAGIVGASERRYDIGLSARDPIIGTDPSGLVFTKIAKEGMCIVTNPANAVANMSSETVDEIFTGGFTNWSQVAGSPIAGSIHVFDYEPQMPLQEAFESIFVEGGPPISASSTVETSEELLREAVSADTQAVGFVRVGQTGATNAVAHNSVPCTVKEAQSGQYGAERNLWTVTKGVPTGPAAVFTEWIRHSSRATALIESGWIALN